MFRADSDAESSGGDEGVVGQGAQIEAPVDDHKNVEEGRETKKSRKRKNRKHNAEAEEDGVAPKHKKSKGKRRKEAALDPALDEDWKAFMADGEEEEDGELSSKRKKSKGKRRRNAMLNEDETAPLLPELEQASKLRRRRSADSETIPAGSSSGAVGRRKREPRDGPAVGRSTDDLEDSQGAQGRQCRQGKGRAKADSSSEEEPEAHLVEAWEKDLRSRRGQGGHERTAFSIKECGVGVIRHLSAGCFLGQRRLEEGGMLLYDGEGKVNLSFLLGSHRAVRRDRDNRVNADRTGPVGEEDIARLKWLVSRARKLRLVSRQEVKSGKILGKRLEAIKRSGHYSLTLEENLVAGDPEAEVNRGEAGVSAAQLDLSFPERPQGEASRDVGKARLRSRIDSRQAQIGAASNHNVDMFALRRTLTAPSLSFDIVNSTNDDDDAGGLEVEVPQELKRRDSRREIFREQLRRTISGHQAQNLLKSDSKDFGSQASQTSQGPATNGDTSKDAVAEKRRERPKRTAAAAVRRAESREGPSLRESTPSSQTGPAVSLEGAETPSLPSSTATAGAAAKSLGSSAPAGTESGAEAEPRQGVSKAEEADNPDSLGLQKPVPEGEQHDQHRGQPEDHGTGPVTAVTTPFAAEEAFAEPEQKVSEEVPNRQASHSQWSDISPTAMWGGHSDHWGPEEVPEGVAEPQHKVSVEISPTVPFVHGAPHAEGCAEISPTVPFLLEGAAGSAPHEISPTIPFVHGLPERPLEEAAEPGASQGDGLQKPPAAAPTIAPNAGAAGSEASAASGAPQQHFASAPSEPSGSDDEGGEASGQEEQRAEERAWLRHKRRLARLESREKWMADQKSRVGRGLDLSRAALPDEERLRFEAVVSISQEIAAVPRPHLAGLSVGSLEEAQDLELFTGFRSGTSLRRGPSFFGAAARVA
mmetsp:Transcript_2824/g.6627  ORF Transcript_2824/g.6627 Transcript_2824/m.6627 type:complete len:928 (-) Transcript_2824:216-2999(-)|eukprot:CAMPEP_0170581852 /NCGR_PEP_ID=MMETSP0224-20130122/7265_1 /TAXON_ID=285029 /ORGANISM="Togula jolla, Strain CCCM 725" /LENGTH=927 /DNA_ID=CAMNT_0010905025 /DNA_START=35 /DNA_END=2818 /DNA_ORIENTATION=+